MSGHTPGPHTVVHRPGRELTGFEAEIAELEEAEPYALGSVKIPETNFQCIFDGRVEGQEEQALADGHLYAAAPETAAELERVREINAELMEALKAAEPLLEGSGFTRTQQAHAKVVAALAKHARAETSRDDTGPRPASEEA